MLSHYVKLGPAPMKHAREVFLGAQDATEQAVLDITNGGEEIKYSWNAGNGQPFLAIYGARCVARGVRDNYYPDTIFIWHLEPLRTRPLERLESYQAIFELRTSGSNARDAIPRAVRLPEPPALTRGQEPQPAETITSATRRVPPSPELRKRLARAPVSLRVAARYRDFTQEDAGPFIKQASQIWRKHDLSRHVSLIDTSRAVRILSGLIIPESMTASEQRAIWDRFDFALFNKFEADTRTNSEAIFALLSESLTLPIPEACRATLWSLMAEALQPHELRKELADLAGTLGNGLGSPDGLDPWLAVFRSVIEPHATSADPLSAELGDLLQRIKSDPPSMARSLRQWLEDGLTSASSSIALPRAITKDSPLEADRAPRPAEPASGLNAWMRQRLGIEDLAPTAFLANIVASTTQLPVSINSTGLFEFCSTARTALEEMRLKVDTWLAQIPPSELLQQRTNECTDAYTAASQYIAGELLDEYLQSFSIEPRALQEVADLCHDATLWANLPGWWWPDPDRGAEFISRFEERFPEARWLVAFAHPPSRKLADFVRKKVSGFPVLAADHTLLRRIPGPEDGVPADVHLEQQLRELNETASALTENQRRYSDTLSPLLRDGLLTQGEFVRTCEQLNRISDITSQDTASALALELSTIRDSQALTLRLDRYRTRIDQLRVLVPNLMQRMSLTDIAPADETPVQQTFTLELDHVYVGDESRKKGAPTLFFRPLDDDPKHAFGTVLVPILLRSSSRIGMNLTLHYIVESSSRLRRGWPAEHREIFPILPGSIKIGEKDWTQIPNSERVATSIVCRVSIRRPTKDDHLGITISIHDRTTGTKLSESKHLVWSRIESAHTLDDARPAIRIDWSEAVVVDYARNHPVGPQRPQHTQRLQERVMAGNSVAVIAPRRFGKSTLIELMTQLLDSEGVLTIHESCDNYRLGSTSHINHAALWSEIASRLPMTLPDEPPHLELKFDGGSPPLPVPETFDRLRRAAAERSKRGVLVFLDEAQLFFGAGNSLELATRVRNLLSKRLSRREPGMVPFMLGFVGLPTLNQKRLGELFPILQPIYDVKLHEGELYQLISSFSGDRLQTTREARERIVDISANLLILNRILSKVNDIVRDDFRPWVTRADVLRVEEDIKTKLRNGDNPDSIKSYLLDVLNESVTPTEWKPIAAYPVALALAVARAAGFRDEDAVTASQQVLQEWIDKIFGTTDSASGLPAYDLERIREHLQILRDIGVLKNDHRFVSEFLEAALVGIGREAIPDDDEFKDSLFRGGLRFVKLPSDLIKVAGGAQATVYRAEQGRLAVRAVELRTDSDRERFLERIPMYESLRDLHRSNEEHTAHIMNLREIGLAKIAGSTCAVQLYSWIEGRPLEQHGEVSRLAPRVIARLGRLLAGCLSLVHQRGIVHRDISPRNIILQERSLSPVLIDFGFASYTNDGKTQLPDNNAAPEVRGLPARWSAAADVYALARTLYRTADPQHARTRQLHTVLQPFLLESPTSRGTLEELARVLESEEDRLKNREACELVTSDLSRIIAPERDAYSPVLGKRKKDLEGLALGLFADPFERALMVANLVNQIAESKGSSIGELVRGRSHDPASVFQTLRNIDAHGQPDFSEARRKLNRASAQLIDGAETIGKWLGLTSLRDVVKYLVHWEPPP